MSDPATEHSKPKLLDVLLVDDNEPDVRLFQLATAEAPVEVTVVREGGAALRWLARVAEEGAAPPDLVVLDLHLPEADGFEVLEYLKRQESLRSIPVVVLSTSPREEDVLRAYRAGAASYVIKPGKLDDYLRVIGFLVEYWGQHVQLPRMAGC